MSDFDGGSNTDSKESASSAFGLDDISRTEECFKEAITYLRISMDGRILMSAGNWAGTHLSLYESIVSSGNLGLVDFNARVLAHKL